MAKNKEPSQRQLRVGEEIRHVLADVFLRADCDHPDLQNISITVTEVDVSPDLRNAIAYVYPLGKTAEQDVIVRALNEDANFFNREVARKVIMKFSPRIKFMADARFDYAEKIENLIRQVSQND